jgi:glutamate racemase
MNSVNIGVIDSGVGGMTVVGEIAKILPGAAIIYFGDSANVPYGNRAESEIIDLTCAMLDFMREKGVALVAVACNTISTLIDKLQPRYQFPIFSIIKPAAAHIAASTLAHVGLFATEFTVKTGHYQKLIHEKNPSIKVHAVGSKSLAALMEASAYDQSAVDAEVSSLLSILFSEYPVKDIILGCTHYPIALHTFRKYAPDINFIDPAALQAREVRRYLESHGYVPAQSPGSLEIYTSGTGTSFTRILESLEIRIPSRIHITGKNAPS